MPVRSANCVTCARSAGEQAVVVERGGAQLAREVQQLLHGLGDEALGLLELALEAGRRVHDRRLEAAGDRRQRLVDLVVEVLGDALALVLLRAQDGARRPRRRSASRRSSMRLKAACRRATSSESSRESLARMPPLVRSACSIVSIRCSSGSGGGAAAARWRAGSPAPRTGGSGPGCVPRRRRGAGSPRWTRRGPWR